jgi:hypothetical protein
MRLIIGSSIFRLLFRFAEIMTLKFCDFVRSPLTQQRWRPTESVRRGRLHVSVHVLSERRRRGRLEDGDGIFRYLHSTGAPLRALLLRRILLAVLVVFRVAIDRSQERFQRSHHRLFGVQGYGLGPRRIRRRFPVRSATFETLSKLASVAHVRYSRRRQLIYQTK